MQNPETFGHIIPFALDGKRFQCFVNAERCNAETGAVENERLYTSSLNDPQDAVQTVARVVRFYQNDLEAEEGPVQTTIQGTIVYKLKLDNHPSKKFMWITERVSADGKLTRVEDTEE
ncbi:hypothetical protein [Deinococcus cellulosilyticus]|uniref:Uncharacterized protein n=1 Tax=Deinococcus cellulosilyticus (strain DSM 18568 / NBRC 106333 / KACC 11606 / 5516J-15) TaxID=1223518 RepID=A0A511N9Y2_DEIC1|nr:hypothetical protein [Deinococcus cellulosilyticus]GEM49632.1 hypothetical protein DC3_52670 [Deinococcus cellulosilyticus NBRC 106333 = KACC 11606]